jgi:hypothetical protein
MSVEGVPESSALLDKVISIVKDDSGKLTNPDDYSRNINAAIKIFSKHKPDTSVADVTGNGTHDYSLPTGWVDGFSIIKSIEYPVDNVPEDFLDEDDYKVYQGTSVKYIRLLTYSPSASDSFRVMFTIPRTDTTIPDNDVDALCNLAASLCLEELANAFTQTSDSTIDADSVNWRTKGYEFGQRAKRLMQLYKEHIGIKGDDVTPAASAVKDFDMKYPGGIDRLTHPRRQRGQR